MVRRHHWLSGHELEQTPGDDEGQGSLCFIQSMWVQSKGLQRVRHDWVTEKQKWLNLLTLMCQAFYNWWNSTALTIGILRVHS